MNTSRKGRRPHRLLLGSAPLLLAAFAASQETTRASIDSAGVESDENSEFPVVSRTGRYVGFQSYATNLVAGDLNFNMDVFVHDRQTGTTQCASVAMNGMAGDGLSREIALAADGRFAAFMSDSGDLVPGDTNFSWDIFVRDFELGTTERVSVTSLEGQVIGINGAPSISADGRYVAFMSSSNALVPGDTNGYRDVFVRDRLLGTTERVSVATGGGQSGGGVSDSPSISADGRLVAFLSSASNLVPGDTNNAPDVFVHDRLLQTTVRVSVDSTGFQAAGANAFPSLALDGTAVVFESLAPNLVAGDTNNAADVFLHDLATGATERISRGHNSSQPNGASTRATISADGGRVLFQSSASNLVLNDQNGSVNDVFLFDRASGTTTVASLSFDHRQVVDGAEFGSLSPGGHVAVFVSWSFKLVPQDQNSARDIFVRDMTPPTPPTSFCAADSLATPCPCANQIPNGLAGGCLNSLGISGALLLEGTPRLSADTLRLTGANLPNSTAMLLQGTLRENGGQGSLLGDGLLCVSGTIVRLGAKPITMNQVVFPEVGDVPLSVRGGALPGSVKTYQLWYRNAANYCTPETFNLTDAWEVTWTL